MQEPKILFFLCVWRRPEITELCFMGLKRLMKHNGNAKSLAVISEKSMIPLCKTYGIDFVEHENEPLGKKKNFGLDEAMKREWDYLIELGSDDLILNDIFDLYKPLMKEGADYFGSDAVFYIDAISGECRHYKKPSEGAYAKCWGLGRCYSRKMIQRIGKKKRVLAKEHIIHNDFIISAGEVGFLSFDQASQFEKIGFVEILDSGTYSLWTDKAMRAMDNDANERIEANGFKFRNVENSEGIMADIKSDENLWAMNFELGEIAEKEIFLNKLSKEEKALFFANQKKLKQRRIEHA